MWSPDGIEFDYLRESQSAGQKTTNQNCHCHSYTRFLQLENKVLILAVDLPLFNLGNRKHVVPNSSLETKDVCSIVGAHICAKKTTVNTSLNLDQKIKFTSKATFAKFAPLKRSVSHVMQEN